MNKRIHTIALKVDDETLTKIKLVAELERWTPSSTAYYIIADHIDDYIKDRYIDDDTPPAN